MTTYSTGKINKKKNKYTIPYENQENKRPSFFRDTDMVIDQVKVISKKDPKIGSLGHIIMNK